MTNTEREMYKTARDSFRKAMACSFNEIVQDRNSQNTYAIPVVSEDGTYLGNPTDGDYYMGMLDGQIFSFNNSEYEGLEYEKPGFVKDVSAFVFVSRELFRKPASYVQEQAGALKSILCLPEKERLSAVRTQFDRSMITIDCLSEGGPWDGILKSYGYAPKHDVRLCLYDFFSPFAGRIRIPPILQQPGSSCLDVRVIFDKKENVFHIPIYDNLPLLLEKIKLPVKVRNGEMSLPCLERKWELPEVVCFSLEEFQEAKDFQSYIRNSPMKDFL